MNTFESIVPLLGVGLTGQIYREAKRLGWPHDAALDAANCAERDYGTTACATASELQSVINEVLRQE